MGVLGKALAGLGKGMAVVGEESLRDRAMMRREEALMKLRGTQEQETYARNRADALTDQEAAGTSAATAQLSKQEYEGGLKAAEWSNQENVAKQKAESDLALERERNSGAIKLERAKEGKSEWKADELEKYAKGLVAAGMGLDSKNIMNFDKELQKDFSDKVARVVLETRENPDAGPSVAYRKVINDEDVAHKSAPRPWSGMVGALDAATAKKLGVETKQETPPIAGARKADDGKWYLQKDGNNYLVTP